MVKRGDTVEKVYGRAMEVAEEITRETEEKLKSATNEEEKQTYTYIKWTRTPLSVWA